MTQAYINRIGTAVPPFDVHQRFVAFAASILAGEADRRLFARMERRAQIEHRYSFFAPSERDDGIDSGGFYRRGRFPDTATRMQFFERHAPVLAGQALESLDLGSVRGEITHLIVACCTGFYAPGIDIDIVERFALPPSVERTIIGFMGCYAAISALKLARHIVRSDRAAKVLVVNLEMCTIHLQESDELDQLLCFALWGDGCSAALVSAEPTGIELGSFHSATIDGTAEQMSWRIGRQGFDMVLSGSVPASLAHGLPRRIRAILGGRDPQAIAHWAVHPGGRSILDAVGAAIGLDDDALRWSRDVLRRFGNMSSATVMFVLRTMLERGLTGLGCAMAFGPGLTAESMVFELAGQAAGKRTVERAAQPAASV